MGLLDKAKERAGQLAEKAQEAGKAGQAKIEEVQIKRKADTHFRDLGALLYADRTGRATSETPAEMERVVGELRALEEEHGAAIHGSAAD